MAKFIEQVVDHLLTIQTDFRKITLVLPGNRPQLFLKKSFREKCQNSILPEMISIDDWVRNISDLQSISQIQLWFESYKAYKQSTENPESFDEFLKWIPTLIKDFDDIQTSLVDSDEIFEYLVSAERIKKWGHENLDVGSNQIMSKHLHFWKMAHALFLNLNSNLLTKNQAYRGLIYKEAVNKVDDFLNLNDHHFVFVGLNALSQAEKKLIETLQKNNRATLLWDADAYYINDFNQEAGHFLRKHKAENSGDFLWVQKEFEKPKNIQVVEVGKRVGQAKYLNQILENIPKQKLTETAVVLAEETLLPAVLSSLPSHIDHVNITMGFPLDKSTMAYFFKSVFELHMNSEKMGQGNSFYYKNVLDVISNPIFKEENSKNSTLNLKIRKENRIFNSIEFLQTELKESIYKDLFSKFKTPKQFVEMLNEWIEQMMQEAKVQINDLDKEYLYRFSLLFHQLLDELTDFDEIQNFKTLYILYNRLLQNESISFVGEPLAGLQIVGLLETRLLDFENVIITSVNEGVIPPGRVENSFIPFDIRREMGLNTYSENDAIFAYHFYRLLQRAQNIQLLYNAETDSLSSGERSRFIAQMEIESPHPIKHIVAAPKFQAVQSKLLEIPKTPSVMDRLAKWSNSISASSINNYVRNPLEFYQNYVLRIKEFEDAEEHVGARVLGNIVHKSLEKLYEPYLKKILIEQDFLQIESEVQPILKSAFETEYGQGDYRKGKNHLIYKIAETYLHNVIDSDRKLASKNELVILGIEQKLTTPFTLSNGQNVNLIGFIDRIDSLNGQTRIIDYKTGSVKENTLKLNSEKFSEIFDKEGFDKPIQLLFYASLYFGNGGKQPVSFGIYPLKNPQKGIYNFSVDKEIYFEPEIFDQAKVGLSNLIEEILNPSIPFVEKEVKSYKF